MELDKKLDDLPLTKSNPTTLNALFGNHDVTPMWVADMDFEIAKPIQEALIKRITNSGFGYEYKPESFHQAQQQWYQQQYHVNLDRDHVLYSPSITTSIACLIERMTPEKCGVIIQPPVFMEFKDVIRKTKREVIKNPLRLVDKHYEIDFQQLEELAKSVNNTMLILCNPHNPVGRVWTKEELRSIITICKDNNVLLVADEVHKDIVLFENQFTSVLHFEDSLDRVVVCTSEAKSFNLCGIADSMVVIADNEVRHVISEMLSKYNLGRTNALTRVALETAYTHGDEWLRSVIAIIEDNIRIIEEELSDSKISLIKPEGTYQVWLDFRDVFADTKEMFRSVTDDTGLGLNAGHWFGREGALFMRMNIATSSERVMIAIKKIKRSGYKALNRVESS